MTEEILQAAILKLRSKALEQYGIIKDIYHRPAASDSVDKIAQHALNLAQIEGAVITLQQYSESLAKQTEAEEISNAPVAEEQPEESEQPEPEENLFLENTLPILDVKSSAFCLTLTAFSCPTSDDSIIICWLVVIAAL